MTTKYTLNAEADKTRIKVTLAGVLLLISFIKHPVHTGRKVDLTILNLSEKE